MRPFAKVYVEITTVCNLRCPFCPPTRRDPGFISRQSFGHILEELSGKTRALYLHVKGEPLLHPELGSLLDDAGQAGFEVRLTTNGTLLESRIQSLLGHPALTRVNISMHSLEALPPEDRRSKAESMLTAARRLAAEPSVKIVSLRYWDSPTAERSLLVLTDTINIHKDERFVWPSLGPEPATPADSPIRADFGDRGFCRALRDQAGILLDGTVIPCCLDAEGDISLGSIYESSWDSIMASQRARALYDGFSSRRVVEPLCRTCGFRTRFNLP